LAGIRKFKILILPIHEHRMSFPLFESSSIFSSMFDSFIGEGFFLLGSIIPKYLFFVAVVNVIVFFISFADGSLLA
jgi:hypothetical protein